MRPHRLMATAEKGLAPSNDVALRLGEKRKEPWAPRMTAPRYDDRDHGDCSRSDPFSPAPNRKTAANDGQLASGRPGAGGGAPNYKNTKNNPMQSSR